MEGLGLDYWQENISLYIVPDIKNGRSGTRLLIMEGLGLDYWLNNNLLSSPRHWPLIGLEQRWHQSDCWSSGTIPELKKTIMLKGNKLPLPAYCLSSISPSSPWCFWYYTMSHTDSCLSQHISLLATCISETTLSTIILKNSNQRLEPYGENWCILKCISELSGWTK